MYVSFKLQFGVVLTMEYVGAAIGRPAANKLYFCIVIGKFEARMIRRAASGRPYIQDSNSQTNSN